MEEAHNHSAAGSEFEQVQTTDPEAISADNSQLLLDYSNSNSSDEYDKGDSSNLAKKLHKYHENNINMMRSLMSAENGELRTDIETLKMDNKLCLEKNNTLVAKVDSLQAHIGEQKAEIGELLANNRELQARLELVELKSQLASEQTVKIVEAKMKEMGDQLEEKQRNFMVENERKLSEKQQDTDNKEDGKRKVEQLVKEVKALEQKMADLTVGKVAVLESQQQHHQEETEDGQDNDNKCSESCKEMEKPMVGSNFEFTPPHNCWSKGNGNVVAVKEDGLTVTKKRGTKANFFFYGNMMAKFGYATNLYFEVLVKERKDAIFIGVTCAKNMTNNFYAGGDRNTCCIASSGTCHNAGICLSGHFPCGFSTNDTVGCGVMALPGTRMRVFFVTRNGVLHGTPAVIIASRIASKELYPMVCLSGFGYLAGSSIEANFGADLDNKPFSYNIAEHKF